MDKKWEVGNEKLEGQIKSFFGGKGISRSISGKSLSFCLSSLIFWGIGLILGILYMPSQPPLDIYFNRSIIQAESVKFKLADEFREERRRLWLLGFRKTNS